MSNNLYQIFRYMKIQTKQIVNYKVLDLVELYNFDMKFIFNRFCVKKLKFFTARFIFTPSRPIIAGLWTNGDLCGPTVKME